MVSWCWPPAGLTKHPSTRAKGPVSLGQQSHLPGGDSTARDMARDRQSWRHSWPPGTLQRVGSGGQARQSRRRPGRGAIGAPPAASPASSPVSALCSLALDLIPYSTWDLSPSLSCAFKETPLFYLISAAFYHHKEFLMKRESVCFCRPERRG